MAETVTITFDAIPDLVVEVSGSSATFDLNGFNNDQQRAQQKEQDRQRAGKTLRKPITNGFPHDLLLNDDWKIIRRSIYV